MFITFPAAYCAKAPHTKNARELRSISTGPLIYASHNGSHRFKVVLDVSKQLLLCVPLEDESGHFPFEVLENQEVHFQSTHALDQLVDLAVAGALRNGIHITDQVCLLCHKEFLAAWVHILAQVLSTVE